MRIWPWRARPGVDDLIHESMTNARAALEEARAARRAAESPLIEERLNQAVANSRATLEVVESFAAELRVHLIDDENHGRRAARLSLLTLVILIVSAWLILRGAAGLRDPSADSLTFGGITVAVEVDGPPTNAFGLPFEKAPTFGVAGTFFPDGNVVFYDVFFPTEFVGKRYALLLEDGAILRKLGNAASGTPQPVACRETGGSDQTAYSIEHRCQVVYGTVPSQPTTDDLIRSLIAPDSCTIDGLKGQFSMARVQLHGTLETPMVRSVDWAHDKVTFPGLFGGMSNRALNRWNGVELNHWYGTGLQDACKMSTIPVDATITDSNPSDLTVTHYALSWPDQEAMFTTCVIAKHRGAEATANVFVAVGGILAGLAVGLVPVVYEALRAGRKRRRASAA